MAKRKKNETVVLENIELKPQVLGYTYQKKSNLGRVIFIFLAFILAVYNINDISVFINNLLGRQTASTIAGGGKEEPNNPNTPSVPTEEDDKYKVFSSELEITKDNLVLKNFKYENNILTFNASNKEQGLIDLSDKKLFIETYSEEHTLLERFKIDINSLSSGSGEEFSLNISNPFYYIALSEKTVEDYPNVTLKENETGRETITCSKGEETIVYTFEDNLLTNINDTIQNNNPSDPSYNTLYNRAQTKVNNYNGLDGITATFNGSINGFTAVLQINLKNADISSFKEKYYYKYEEEAKVVNFEMKAYGFTCN